ncbi:MULTISPECIES: hypothetical protein [Rahnella]|jgi:hypothetical protein|uniref:KTSC domain-containing protein n=1 Tax=Rahnella sp. (strain Y9602) TaxID=2703885 RepID=A0A0H3F6R7_RAHSY|nr:MULTISPECIES: hypothetical protein [Rahnella]AFE57186.1 hypothetical protein Q7S_04650 [Rahnella aquatilis HX2]AYA05952.1 hypothetical protein D3Z09_05060 [Rahnella aquatilis]ADW72604.1 hypothetical protein Rahaq_0980 [Rahnella aceris]AZP41187.1 hypothetical protein EJP79_04760 [Rahnella aquatilis]AZP45528.1 hypothetical protein EJP81_04765 [Rahnella aquatilis]
MEKYQNRGGNSGIVAFTTTEDSITVKFKDGWHYIYNSIRPGVTDVDHMIAMAKAGSGLHGYINRKIRNNHFHKYR